MTAPYRRLNTYSMDLFPNCHTTPPQPLIVQNSLSSSGKKRLYGPGRGAVRPQGANAPAGDSPQSRYTCPAPQPGQAPPPQGPEHGRSRMAFGGVDRRAEHQPRTGTAGPQQLGSIMRRGGDEARQRQHPAPAAAQVQPGLEPRRQPGIARHHQHQPPRPAKGGDAAPQRQPVRGGIVAEHHAAQAARQNCHHRQRVGPAGGVGEKPERRKCAPPPPLYPAAPGQ